ncbi:MAG TPA: MFS transporter [Gemmatimonadaceae bacterium]
MTSPAQDGVTEAAPAWLRRVVDVRAGEVKAMIVSAVFFFFLLSSYFVLRPIRDAVAASSGVNQLPLLFLGTLSVTLLCNPLFSWLVVRFPVRRVIPISYQFFVVSFLVFYAVLRFVSAGEGTAVDVWMGRAFFVWITVFALFNTSIFWCLMADAFTSEQAKRLFGFIAVGGSFGSVTGSALTAELAPKIGAVNVLLVSAVLLQLAIITIMRWPPIVAGVAVSGESKRETDRHSEVIGGSIWSGFTHITKSPYLLGICLFMLLYVFGSTILYFAQSDLVGKLYADRTARTAVLAQIEFAVQTLTVITQIFFTGRIIRWLGLALALAVLPAVSVLGFGVLGAMATFQVFAVFMVLRRATNFAIMNPAMEVLFTVVRREDKYKAKNVIETFVYRGGDQLSGWAYAGLAAVGLTLAGISYVAVPLSVFWLGLGIWLGRRQAQMASVVAGSSSQEGPRHDRSLPEPSRRVSKVS